MQYDFSSMGREEACVANHFKRNLVKPHSCTNVCAVKHCHILCCYFLSQQVPSSTPRPFCGNSAAIMAGGTMALFNARCLNATVWMAAFVALRLVQIV